MEKIKTGINGFDELIQGGFPKGKTILLSGTPGTGKTIFALEYLYNGAKKFNEKGIYFAFEEKESDLKNQALQFGWNFDKLENERKVRIIHIPPSGLSKNTVKDIIEIAQKNKVSRLVIDSISTLSISAPLISETSMPAGELLIRRFIYSFINHLKLLKDTTSVIISHNVSKNSLSGNTISEFLCDGVISISYESLGGNYSRGLTVRKMREIKNDEDIHPLEISKNGIVVHNIN